MPYYLDYSVNSISTKNKCTYNSAFYKYKKVVDECQSRSALNCADKARRYNDKYAGYKCVLGLSNSGSYEYTNTGTDFNGCLNKYEAMGFDYDYLSYDKLS